MLEQNILVVIDYQNDFVTGPLKVPGADKIENAVAKRINAAYENGDRVIFLKDTHPKTYLKTLEGKNLPVEHCISMSEGHNLYGKIKALEGLHGSITIEKLQFGTTDIPSRLTRLQVVPREFALIGVASEICVISVALILKTQFRETPIKIYSEATAGMTKAAVEAAWSVCKSCHIEVI
jgi:nicotinamidase-related amidase